MLSRRRSSSSTDSTRSLADRRRSRRRSSALRVAGLAANEAADKQTRRPSVRQNRWIEAHKTLKEILKKRGNVIVFREFLKTEYSHENLDFWLAVEEYKNLTNEKEIGERAQYIFDTYIRQGAPDQVNLTFSTHQAVNLGMTSPSPQTFDVAQQEIYKLIENDSFRRFIQNVQNH